MINGTAIYELIKAGLQPHIKKIEAIIGAMNMLTFPFSFFFDHF